MANLESFFSRDVMKLYHNDLLISCNGSKNSKENTLGYLELNYYDCKSLLDSLFYYGAISDKFYVEYADIIFNDFHRIKLYIENMDNRQYSVFIHLTKNKFSSILSTEAIIKALNN